MAKAKAYTVNEFCALYRVSRSQLYKLWREGQGPKFMKLGKRRLISRFAADQWRMREEERTERERLDAAA